MKFILASQNRHKLVEMQDILSAHGVEVVLQGDLGLHVEVEETGSSFAENAMLKAKAVFRRVRRCPQWRAGHLFRPVRRTGAGRRGPLSAVAE